MVRRKTNQILIQIIDTCRDGANKTRIVYASGLNFYTIKLYLQVMTERGILTESNGLYRTTEKGLEALRHLKALREIIPEF